ncbi:ABC transporter permease [Pedobacter flavus]|uniref:Transport permease protein n=1 Tax=Pedobacter flavus TaxID=3113906 RepID=A0ABU7H0T6_9SPHI|nr:ABC transporter permease [Pedobacter sp. VNH31]MEE1884953.1 ABC transporter permease [Pedobacter sp. VNH31]
MIKKYNNTTATLALAKASFRSILRSPSAVVFTLAFPLIFILVFGFLSTNGVKIDLAIAPTSNLDNPVIKALEQNSVVRLIKDTDTTNINSALTKGNYDGLIDVQLNKDSIPNYITNITYTTASPDKTNILKSLILNIQLQVNMANQVPTVTEVRETMLKSRPYTTIDFILPGQLGFSLLSTGVFGTAFVFFSLRQNLVIKRFFATPVRKSSIVLGEGIARIGFALLGALTIILLGNLFFGFTLVNGYITVINMLVLSFLGVLVFMGFGFVISGIAKSESTIPPISNIITLPQFLLSGTFFSVSVFPTWLQYISKAMPLTYLNDAMRKVAFEGLSLWDVRIQILVLLVWGVVVYGAAVKFFKWE